MNIYQQISQNKIKTFFILVFFILFLSFLFFVIGKLVDDPLTYFLLGLAISFTSALLSYFYSDRLVLFISQAKPASKEKYFDFYTVTENLSIAAGLPMPKLYVIEDSALNAFATGRNPKNAVIVATLGLLQKLDRRELEGVIAHEISHIKNYDILLATVVSVLVGLVAYVSDWVIRKVWWHQYPKEEETSRKESQLLYLFLFIFLIISPLIATLIQLAFSRRREFLADASAAFLTRYPEGLAKALEKISSDSHILKTASNATAHLFIVNPFEKKGKFLHWLAGLFSTHPPVEERIRILRSM